VRPRRTAFALGCLLAAAGCDSFNFPAPPAREVAVHDSAAATTAGTKSRRAGKAGADPAADELAAGRIRRGLRRLVVAEEAFFAENGVYTRDLARVGFAPEGETSIRFLWVSRDGWAASGTHPEMPGRDCVIYVGRAHEPPTTLKYVRSGREGVPVCDAPSTARPVAVAPRDSTPAAAAAPAPAPAIPDTGSALDAVEPTVSMKVDLRNLIRSQDSYYGTQGIYARRTEPFALQYLWHRGVTITILNADGQSWSARATHAKRPGKSCVIWMGPVPHRPATEAQNRVPDQPGTPACDD